MTRTPLSLRQILTKINESKPALVVFDLDSTLFDVAPRFEKVLLDFSREQNFNEKFSQFTDLFQKIKVQKGDWGLRDIIERAGETFFKEKKLSDEVIQNFRLDLKNYWIQKFFTNEYLQHDIPYPGAVEFVQEISKQGHQIVYLTGRDIHRMGPGSLETLKKWNFPLGTPQHQLVLKPHQDLEDAGFKRDWFLNLPENKYSQIWFFENEPANIDLIRATGKPIQIVFFDSTHSRQAVPPTDLPWIQNFIWDEK